MRTAIRWIVVIVVIAHGLIHLLGAAKGFGWAEVGRLTDPIGVPAAAAWLAAAIALVLTGVLLAIGTSWWWIVGAIAVVLSQAVILTSWGDAKVGTAANVVLLIAVVHGYASQGPRSYRARYRHLADAALGTARPAEPITETDLAPLPRPVADYVRRSGAVGRPHVRNFRASIHGRIRGGVTKPWMDFTGEQVNTYRPQLSRLLYMDATMFGLPVDVLHVFTGGRASMQVKACSLVPMVSAAGPDMDRAETVTMFNDICVLAPAALVDAPITWQDVDDRHVRGTFTHGAQAVSAELTFNDDHELVDFVSDDRLRASPDGKSFVAQRWSTPIGGYRTVGARWLGASGEGRWHAPAPEGEFGYLEFVVDDITYNDSTDNDSTDNDSADNDSADNDSAGRTRTHVAGAARQTPSSR